MTEAIYRSTAEGPQVWVLPYGDRMNTKPTPEAASILKDMHREKAVKGGTKGGT